MPCPFVSVKNSLLYPKSPREGTANSSRMRLPMAFICNSVPFLLPIAENTGPVISSGTSTTSRSIGSWRTPSISLYNTRGVET